MNRLTDILYAGCALLGTAMCFCGLLLCAWLGYELFARGAMPWEGAGDLAREERFYAKCAATGFSREQCIFFHCGAGDGCSTEGFRHDR
jgi:hypothetical protein